MSDTDSFKVFSQPARPLTGPTVLTLDTIIQGTFTDEDIWMLRYRYCEALKCSYARAVEIAETHRVHGTVFQFSFYEFMTVFGPTLPFTRNPASPLDSIMSGEMVLMPDAFELMALEADVPQIDG